MKLDSPAFRAILTPELHQLHDLFEKNNYELRIAGGAVRDLLMHVVPHDIDFATTATPSQMHEMLNAAQVRMLHMRGESHGTVTARIGEHNFECTTLRIDVVCDGRRAEVQFTNDWALDAERRDLTVNSLFLGIDGTVYDYTDGLKDIETRRIRFVGKAETRIQEDYLRILRYFRFFGRIALDNAVHEETTLQAIRDNKDGLKGVSAERIWTELRRILIGRLAPQVVSTMIVDCQLHPLLGVPSESEKHLQRFKTVYENGKKAEKIALEGGAPSLESMTMVAALCTRPEHIAAFHAITKLSNVEKELGEFIMEYREEAEKATAHMQHEEALRFWKRLLARILGPFIAAKLKPVDVGRMRNRVWQLGVTVGASDEILKEVSTYLPPEFPISGNDLMHNKVKAGPQMHLTKTYLFDMFVDSDMTMSKEHLLSHALDDAIPKPASPSERTSAKRRRTPTS